MNNRAVTLSIVMALLAVFFVQSYVSQIEENTQKKFGAEVLVLTAQTDIKEMQNLDETQLDFKKVPKQFLEPSAIFFEKKEKDEQMMADLKKFSAVVALVPIKKGEQISHNKISEPSIRTGLSPQITPGKRAITVPVDEISGLAKLVKPGDRIDVLGVLDVGEGKAGKISKTLLQDVVVLAVGRYITNNMPRTLERDIMTKAQRPKPLNEFDGFNSVTLEVEPAQAQMLALVVASGGNKVILSLRNNDDTERVGLSSIGISEISGVRAPAANQGNAPASTGPVMIRSR